MILFFFHVKSLNIRKTMPRLTVLFSFLLLFIRFIMLFIFSAFLLLLYKIYV